MPNKLLKISPKHQITLPKKIIDRFPDTRYFELEERDEEVVLRPVRITPHGDALRRVREKMKKLGIAEDVISEAVAYTRAARK